MTSCEEAVYQVTVCGYGSLDGDTIDGVPCESICTASTFVAVTVIPPTSAPIEKSVLSGKDEIGQVTRVIDGDTIDVLIDGKTARIRYVQTNTPEHDEPCFRESTKANADLVANKTVRLIRSKELVGSLQPAAALYSMSTMCMVNRVLVERGFAEVVLYPPNDAHYEEFLQLEREAAAAGRGCHPDRHLRRWLNHSLTKRGIGGNGDLLRDDIGSSLSKAVR